MDFERAAAWLAPARRRGVEQLDDPATPDDVRRRAMLDIARANALFGGTRSVVQALRGTLARLPRDATLVDVGTGTADIPVRARMAADDAGIALRVIGIDAFESQLRSARNRLDGAAAGDARRLPLRAGAADLVVCSQLLHHFAGADLRHVVAELHRVSRGWVVISDLRRSLVAAAAFWIASVILRFHPVTRLDGVTSVLRGFTAAELSDVVFDATGVRPAMRTGMFWRVSATWRARATR